MHYATSNNRGFSLVWVCVLLAVAGIALAATLPGGQFGSEANKRATTLQRMQKIEEATRAFMAANLRRPCPSDASQAQSSATFGTEAGNPGICASANFVGGSVVSSAVAGGVPTKALGLPIEYAADGYGRRIMYIVDRNATGAITCHDLQSNNKTGALQILTSSASSTAIDNTTWALISYGSDGEGAYSLQGGSTRFDSGNTNSDVAINAFGSTGSLGSPTFTGKLVMHDPVSGQNGFGNIVWYLDADKNTCALGKAANNGFQIFGGNTIAIGVDYQSSVAVGDINGDGISDLVFGMPYMGSPHQGAVYVIFGSLTGWPQGAMSPAKNLRLPDIAGVAGSISSITKTNPAVVTTGTDIFPTVTTPIRLAGVGGMTQANNKCFVAGTSTTSISLRDMNGANLDSSNYTAYTSGGYAMNGCGAVITNDNGAIIRFGETLAVGDINGDGFDDIVVSSNATASMSVAVILGNSNFSSANLSSLSLASSPDKGFLVKTSSSSGYMGNIALGDVNGDGVKDIVAIESNASTATVIYGLLNNNWDHCGCWVSPTLDTTSSVFTSAFGFQIADDGASGYISAPAAGIHTLAVGDVTNDAYDDILFGGPTYSSNKGSVLVVFGRAFANADFTGSCASPPCQLRLSTQVGTASKSMLITTAVASDNLGNNVLVTDINGDGIKDIIATSNTAIHGISGHTNGWSPSSTFAAESNDIFKIDTSTSRPAMITAACPNAIAVGDVNGDGLPDILIGCKNTSPGTTQGYSGTRTDAGSVFVYYQPSTHYSGTIGIFGSIFSASTGNTITGDGTKGFRIDGVTPYSTATYAFIPELADLNSDGKNDIIVLAPYDSTAPTVIGSAYVIYGRRTVSYDPSIDLTTLQ